MYFEFRNISINYGKKKVLNDVSLMFKKGTISTIIGQNGCGKSSLLRTLSRKVKYSGGYIILEDKEIKTYNRKVLAKKIAYLPQIHDAPSDIDVRTLVSYGRYPHMKFGKTLSRTDNEIIDFALEAAGLKHLEFCSTNTLSGGERQRAWIAMTICQQPEILILDEPTTYLDISYQVEVLELVKKLNREMGLTIIMVLHDLNLAARYSDYLYAIKDNTLFGVGTPKEIITKKNLEEIFKIKATILNDEDNNCPFFIPQKTIFKEII